MWKKKELRLYIGDMEMLRRMCGMIRYAMIKNVCTRRSVERIVASGKVMEDVSCRLRT